MGYTKHRKLELIEVLQTDVVKGKGKHEKHETFKEKATRSWLDLPSDIMINILQRIDVIGIVRSVQRVCTNWQQICKEPCMWRVIYLEYNCYDKQQPDLQKVCKNVVDRSQGQLIDITLKGFCDDELLQYVTDRSSKLRRLEIGFNNYGFCNLTRPLKKFLLLEELSLHHIQIREEAIQTLGRECPMLKTLILSKQYDFQNDELGLAIADNLPGLRHLQLSWCELTDTGLRAILDRCRHLQVLDLQMCSPVDLRGELGKRCSQQIKCVEFFHWPS